MTQALILTLRAGDPPGTNLESLVAAGLGGTLAGGSGTAWGGCSSLLTERLSTDTSIQDIPTAVHFFSGSLVRRVREIGWLNGRICKVGTLQAHACGLPLMRGSGLRHPEKSGTNRIPNPLRGGGEIAFTGRHFLVDERVRCCSRSRFPGNARSIQIIQKSLRAPFPAGFGLPGVIRRELGQCAPVEDCGL